MDLLLLPMPALRELTVLYVGPPALASLGCLAPLAQHTRLRRLDVSYFHEHPQGPPPAALPWLSSLSQLESFSASGMQLQLPAVAALASMTALARLNITVAWAATEGLAVALARLRNLSALTLLMAPTLVDFSPAGSALASLTELELQRLRHHPASPKAHGLGSLSALQSLALGTWRFDTQVGRHRPTPCCRCQATPQRGTALLSWPLPECRLVSTTRQQRLAPASVGRREPGAALRPLVLHASLLAATSAGPAMPTAARSPPADCRPVAANLCRT